LNIVIQGIVLGLTLAILLGPIFITLTQLAVEKGTRAGIIASTGVWISDILIILGCYYFVQQLNGVVNDATFTHWMGLLGGFILIAFGFGALFKKVDMAFDDRKFSANDYFSFWSKGFLVNTVNPFTFVFWISVMTTSVIGEGKTPNETLLFFSTIMMVIISTDISKVLLAKVLRNQLKQNHFAIFTRVAGIALISFGIALLLRTQTF